ncbi:MAG TPA: crossover junction endodeoxyribonuclease RuvC [Methylomirabilota bacterium]|nr:crossover junction endodeoxyribonuclease RuvC [Methylomirabilota bacterium]
MDERVVSPTLRVLGVDPGTLRTGWGVIERRGSTLSFRAAGVLTPKGFHSLPERLRLIYAGITEILQAYAPHVLSLEKAFVAYNVQSALRLGEARGVVLLAAVQAGIRIAEYNPTEIKTAVAGYGRAEKAQVQKAVFALLGGGRAPEVIGLPLSKDATDALAAAICHAQFSPMSRQLQVLPGMAGKAALWRRSRTRSLRNVLPKKTVEQLLAATRDPKKL